METSTPVPPPAPPTPAAERPAGPRGGQLTPWWRLVTGTTWILVFVAFTGVWKASRELGLATWWLGPISQPQPVFVMLLPFVAPAAMVVAALNNARRLPWFGLAASVACAAVGLGDLDRVQRLAYVELAIAAAGAMVSVASTSGLYRRASVLQLSPDRATSEGQNAPDR